MKHCDKCNVEVNTELNHCPLCFNEIKGDNNTTGLYSVSTSKPKEIQKSHKTRKVFFLISLAVMLVCGLINYLTKTPFWSGIVGLSVLYLWILVRHTIMSNRNVFEKIALQILGVLSILLMTNHVSGGGWFLEYVFPALLCFVIFTLNMILFISKRRKTFEISFLIIELIILIISIIFVSIDVCQFKTMHLVVLVASAFSIVGIIVMDGKNLFQEITKKMHL